MRDHAVLTVTHTFNLETESPIPAFTPEPQSFTAFWPVLISYIPLRVSGWVGPGGWLHNIGTSLASS